MSEEGGTDMIHVMLLLLFVFLVSPEDAALVVVAMFSLLFQSIFLLWDLNWGFNSTCVLLLYCGYYFEKCHSTPAQNSASIEFEHWNNCKYYHSNRIVQITIAYHHCSIFLSI
mmetsp:Transcript_13822/g.30081  ORF Transcript_13822/g.30081 Transcript_13822/m.30081 type:complete len:113 (-) Transcript_13822:4-342(-)